MDTLTRKSGFVHVNDIRLHYLDWGGDGDALVFIPGLGGTPYAFGQLALRFVDKFHVLGFSRRGHGDSDTPETGYDVETLTDDFKQFLDVLGIGKAILVGHSAANLELCHFLALYPERVLKLVFLDAAYDRTKFKRFEEKYPIKGGVQPPDAREQFDTVEEYLAYYQRTVPELADVWNEAYEESVRHSLVITSNGKFVEKTSGMVNKAIISFSREYVPEFASIKAPTLSIYAIADRYIFPDYWTEEQKVLVTNFRDTWRQPVMRECIEQFRREVPHARIVEIPHGNHHCVIAHEDLVYDEMRAFLSP